MTDYAKVLTRRFSGNEWVLNGDDYDGLTWLSDTPKPTKKELDALWSDVLAEVLAEKQAKVDAQVSARTKLAALGLSEAEVNALLGKPATEVAE